MLVVPVDFFLRLQSSGLNVSNLAKELACLVGEYRTKHMEAKVKAKIMNFLKSMNFSKARLQHVDFPERECDKQCKKGNLRELHTVT